MPTYRARPRYRYGVPLAGTVDGINRTFTTPDYFVYDGETQNTIRVYHNGRRLIQVGVVAPHPDDGDYTVAESVPGAGYDTVVLLTFAPVPTSELRADYQIG